MNGYQRVKAALRGEPSDCRPVMLHNFQNAVCEAGITFAEFREDPHKAAEAFIRSTEKYDLDGVFIDFDTATLAGACGCKVVKPLDKAAVATGSILDDIQDVFGLKPVNIEHDAAVAHWLETSRLVGEYFGDEKYVRCNCDQAPFSLASMLRGSQELMMDLMDEDYEEEIRELLSYCQKATEQFVRLAGQTGAHGVSNGDSVAGPAMISPAMYRKFGIPYEKLIIDAAHENGTDYILHICGDTTPILEKFTELGVDAMELDHKTDRQKMHDILADHTTVCGNLDPSGVFLMGTEENVRKETFRLLETYRDSHRLILCSGCALSTDTPERNMRVFVECARSYR